MRIFKNKTFSKFAKKEGIGNKRLVKAITDAEAGLIDADLGGGLIKQRIARAGEGKSSGYRSIILYRRGDKAFFVFGFAKNELDNIAKADERILKKLAKELLAADDAVLQRMLDDGEIEEI